MIWLLFGYIFDEAEQSGVFRSLLDTKVHKHEL